jgi:hypothetical protein
MKRISLEKGARSPFGRDRNELLSRKSRSLHASLLRTLTDVHHAMFAAPLEALAIPLQV